MKIAILGAAGVRTPLILRSINQRQERLGIRELMLMDIQPKRLETIQQVRLDGKEPGYRICLTSDPGEALDGADYVITTFRVGNMESRVIDERVALRHGCIGQETTGPGGFAMAMRTLPVLMNTLDLMKKHCPGAWLLNFANPSGLLAEAVLRNAGWERAVGICDAPSAMQRAAAGLLGMKAEQIFLDYFGLNHLGWVRSVLVNGKDMLPQFIAMIEAGMQMPEMPFSPEMVSALGMIPNEYLFYYYHSRQVLANMLAARQTRGEFLLELNNRLFDDLERLATSGQRDQLVPRYEQYLKERNGSYMVSETGIEHTGTMLDLGDIHSIAGEGYAGVALDIIEALAGIAPKVLVLNVQNRGAVTGMDAADVVEVPVLAANGMIRPLSVGSIPEACLGLMKQVKAYEKLTIQAARDHSYSAALQALTIHPLVSDEMTARQLLDDYIREHGMNFPELH